MNFNDQGYGSIPTKTTIATHTNVQVIAPATLNAGYTFDAMYDGVTVTVTVPEGGVVKGQRFIVPFLPPVEEPVAVAVGEAIPASSATHKKSRSGSARGAHVGGIPRGVWRDNLCDCCRFGPCHPHFLNAWFCRPILMAQISTRMKMTWLGQRTQGLATASSDDRWRNTFRNIVILTVAVYFIMIITTTPDQMDDETMPSTKTASYSNGTQDGREHLVRHEVRVHPYQNASDDQPEYKDAISNVDLMKNSVNAWVSALFSLYTLYMLIKLRATLRHVYSIPEESCLCWYRLGLLSNNPRQGICGDSWGVPVGWEDICCAFWCTLCVAGQMARHTVDYNERRAVCCNSVGVDNWEEDEAYVGFSEGDSVGEGTSLVV